MTSHALTPEQGQKISECLEVIAKASRREPGYGGDPFANYVWIGTDNYEPFLRDLARTLLEPVEKERDGAARDHHRSWPECPECLHYFREDENYAMLNAKQASELAEAREENTRLREQLTGLAEAAIAYDAGIRRAASQGKSWVGGDMDLDALYEAWIAAARAALEPRPPLRDEAKP